MSDPSARESPIARSEPTPGFVDLIEGPARESTGRPLLALLEDLLHERLRPVQRLGGGHEAMVFRLEGKRRAIALHISPPWRTRAELEWVHDIAAAARRSVPQVVTPIRGPTGTVIEWAGRCVTLFPFVAGGALDREDPALRAEAARLLAAIHRALVGWADGARPPTGAGRPNLRTDVADLEDPGLDRWWETVRSGGLVRGATHGDYYPGNVLCREGRVVGIVDWHEARVGALALELAGATFEFCRDDRHVLLTRRAQAFVGAYREAGGPLPDREIAMLLPLMRWWVREDARTSLAWSAESANPYARKQVEAFWRLADVHVDLAEPGGRQR